MKNFKDKNFIAFTLSEMMVVLLIVSVISAATLPAVVGKKETAQVSTPSQWMNDYMYNGGHYFVSNDRNLVIGADIKNLNGLNRTEALLQTGNATIKLVRPNMFTYATQNRSDIAFFNHQNEYTGKIAADNRGNLAVGKDTAYPHAAAGAAYGNIFFGSGAGSNMRPYIYNNSQKYNTIVGYYAASRYSSVGNKNVIIGRNIENVNLGDNNVIIGNYAASNSYYANTNPEPVNYNTNSAKLAKKYHNTISIGIYSSFNAPYVVSSVNIGQYAGARDLRDSSPVNGHFNVINLGSFAGFNGGYNFSKYSYINIGYYAGSMHPNNVAYSMINIGPWAGANSNLYAVNVGRYAGYDATGGGEYDGITYLNKKRGVNIGNYAGAQSITGEMAVNIGYYAGYGTGTRGSVNIGHYANALVSNMHAIDDFDSVSIGLYSSFHDQYKNNRNTVSIGKYAGYNGKVQYGLFLGGYAGSGFDVSDTNKSNGDYIVSINCGSQRIQGYYKMCIGGGYPYSDTWTTTGWTPKSGDGQTIIMTPGYQGGSTVGWAYTSIYLLAQNVYAYTNSLTTFSDRTLKENIRKTKYGIDKLRKVIVYQYNFKESKNKSIGVIAQELMKVYPDAVSKTFLPNSDGKEYYTVSSDWLIFSLAQAIKDVDNAVVGLQKQLVKNVSQLTKLAVRVNSVENKLNELALSNKELQKKLSETDTIISKMEHK
ncbi:tail fiber domain-containing protein [bacterium]|nr:tail fiber domain-containing protein [bacterium]